jgi:hypothetical protein
MTIIYTDYYGVIMSSFESAETPYPVEVAETPPAENIGYYTVIESEGRGCCFCGSRAVNIHANYAECADCGAI